MTTLWVGFGWELSCLYDPQAKILSKEDDTWVVFGATVSVCPEQVGPAACRRRTCRSGSSRYRLLVQTEKQSVDRLVCCPWVKKRRKCFCVNGSAFIRSLLHCSVLLSHLIFFEFLVWSAAFCKLMIKEPSQNSCRQWHGFSLLPINGFPFIYSEWRSIWPL